MNELRLLRDRAYCLYLADPFATTHFLKIVTLIARIAGSNDCQGR